MPKCAVLLCMANSSTQEPLEKSIPTVNLSSNATLFWRVFIPVFGTVFLTGMLLAFWLLDEEALYLPYSLWWPRIALTAVWIGWLWGVRRTLWRLKRVDANDTHLFATNYWTTARYRWADVAAITESKRLGRTLMHIHLKAPGFFGPVVSFLPGSVAREWLHKHVDLTEMP